jgi:signal transduction histidine kinase/DNA-binding response OmpR family regulator
LFLQPPISRQPLTVFSYYVEQKIIYLREFIKIQERGSVVNELNVLTRQIEQNKKLLAFYINAGDAEQKQQAEKEKPGFFKRVFKGKAIKKEEAKTKDKQLKDATQQLSSQIRMMEKVKGEIGQVKRRQGSTLKNIDNKELSITQNNKVLNEKLNAWMVSLEMDELAYTRMMIEDIDKRHNKTDKLIGIFSLMGAVFLVIIGYVVAGFISRKNAYQAALLAAKNEAEQYSLLQEQFLANMSHEIRTPMNAISGFTEQLLKTPLQQNQRSYLTIVQQSVGYLLVVVNDILDYAKLKADKLTIEHYPFSVPIVIDEVLLLLEETASQKGIRMGVTQAGHVPPVVVSDPVRLKQILLNLLGNALKFTSAGEVNVTITCVDPLPDSCTIQIAIKDTGIGISAKNLTKIFNAFEQAELSTSRKYGGSGLGLSITQKLVSLLNGKISLHSEEGKGTEVILVFDWPVQQHIQEISLAAHFEMESFVSVSTGKCFLIADDEEWNSTLLSTIFDSYQINYVIAKNGKEVLDIVAAKHIDLILMDARMPELDGFEATREIRRFASPKAQVHIIGITADVTDKQIAACYESGMNAVLGKPFSEQLLGEKIYQVLSGSLVKHQPSLAAVIKPDVISAAGYSIAVLEEMGNGDGQFTIKMLRIFMQNGRQALEQMGKSLQQQQIHEIGNLAHKIMPSARQLEALRLLRLLKEIEQAVSGGQHTMLDPLITNALEEFNTIHAGMEKIIKQLEK